MRVRRLSLVFALVIAGLLANASVASALRAYYQSPVTIADNSGVVPAPSVEMRAPGTISSLYVNIVGLTHGWAKDLDIALQSPSGKLVMLMSDACGGFAMPATTFEFQSEGAYPSLNENAGCPSDVYLATNFGSGDTFASAPGVPLSVGLESFHGEDPNGTWKLHIEDDNGSDAGSLASWTLNVESYVDPSLGYTRVPLTGTGSSGETSVVMSKEVKLPRPIADVDVVLKDLSHRFPDDLDILLVSPTGSAVVLMSEVCASVSLLRSNFRFDDAAPTMLPDGFNIAECQAASASVKPTDAESIETAIAGAPNGPYSPTLGVFNGQNASGTWRLYLLDDQGGAEGYIKDFELAITQVPTKSLTPGRLSLKFKKSGSSRILASGRISLTGPAVSATECAGTFKSSLQTKKTRKKGKKRVTTYSRVASVRSKLRLVKGKCGVDLSAKLAKKFAGKRLRLALNYRGGDYLSSFKRNFAVKVKRVN